MRSKVVAFVMLVASGTAALAQAYLEPYDADDIQEHYEQECEAAIEERVDEVVGEIQSCLDNAADLDEAQGCAQL